MAAVVKDPAPRLISPIFFILAGLCFLLPFAGVSCNTAALKSGAGISQQLGGSSSSDDQAMISCLNSLGNVNIATYTGLNLVAGSSPTVITHLPSGCSALNAEGGVSSSDTATAPGQLDLGVQWLLLIALAAMLLGLLLSLRRFALRGLLVAAAAVGAIILLVVDQGQVSSAFVNKIAQSSAGASADGALSGALLAAYFTVSVGIGCILAIVALALVALYNLAAELAPLVAAGSRAGPLPSPVGPYGTPTPAPPGGY